MKRSAGFAGKYSPKMARPFLAVSIWLLMMMVTAAADAVPYFFRVTSLNAWKHSCR